MTHLIDKSALVAEIERLKSIQLSIFSKGETQENCYDSLTCISVYNEILSFIDSLEEEPVRENFEEVDDELYDEYVRFLNYHKKGSETQNLLLCAHHFANWQKEKDQETIELAEDHAMLAGIIKGTEHTISNVRSILNKVAYENNGLDVNGDYCEQPYVELDNEFMKLLKEK